MTRRIDVTKIQARVSDLLSEYRIPSAAIGILRDEEITDFAAGVKNLSTGEPATTDTIYACASMTKAWSALAFMQFVDEGKVGLDEPVQTYLSGFKVADPEVSAVEVGVSQREHPVGALLAVDGLAVRIDAGQPAFAANRRAAADEQPRMREPLDPGAAAPFVGVIEPQPLAHRGDPHTIADARVEDHVPGVHRSH
jgi:hypothetical protein